MPLLWIRALAAVAVVSSIPLIPILIPGAERRIRRAVPALVSFAAGSLLGGATLHLLPAANRELGPGLVPGLLVLLGFLGFFLLESLLWAHRHADQPADAPAPVAVLNLIGDAIHNFVDGGIIAAGFVVDPKLGLAAATAVVLHEIPQELGDFAILLHSGLSFRRAVALNLLSGLAAVGGGVLTLALGEFSRMSVAVLLPIAAGGFIYIAAADLVPELKRTASFRATLAHLGLMIGGIGLLALAAVQE